MFTHMHEPDTVFKCTRNFTPTPDQEEDQEIEDAEDQDAPNVVVRKKSKYLPGERLLLKITKHRKIHQKTNPVDVDNIDKIARSLKRVILSI